jgi:CRP/FNR family transcriptional regulator, anaerobic regulatory protein
MTWFDPLGFSPATVAHLQRFAPHDFAPGTPLFRAGDGASAFVVVLSGKIEVTLTGQNGREILLYVVEPGESCVQTTLGLLGDEAYSGAAVVTNAARLVLIPKAPFMALMDDDPAFRRYVMRAFGRRMADLTHLLEQVAFARIDVRLAAALLELVEQGQVTATQAELAARIGSAREVVTRALHSFATAGLIRTERGHVEILDPVGLRQLAATAV